MANKVNKRSRKFLASGGVKKRLRNGGTITKKGRVRLGHKKAKLPLDAKDNKDGDDDDDDDDDKDKDKDDIDKYDDKDGHLMSKSNLKHMDLDSFFQTAMEEEEQEEEMDNDDDDEDGDDDEDDDDDDDDNDDDDDEDDDDGSKSKKKSKTKTSQNEDDDKTKRTKKKKDQQTLVDEKKKKKTKREDDDDDDDDDEEEEEEDLDVAERRMKQHMSQLAEKDPEFHKFLAQNEDSLLHFGQQEEEEDVDEDDEDDGEQDEEGDKEEEDDGKEMKDDDDDAKQRGRVLTASLLESYEEGAFQGHGISSLKKLVAAYKSACQLIGSSSSSSLSTLSSSNRPKWEMESSQVLDRLMLTCLENCGSEFRHHLITSSDEDKDSEDNDEDNEKEEDDDDKKEKKQKESKEEKDEEIDSTVSATTDIFHTPIHPRTLSNAPQWSRLETTVQSFVRSTLGLLDKGGIHVDLTVRLLKQLSHSIPFLSIFPLLATKALKICTQLWSAPSVQDNGDDDDGANQYHMVRLHAFLRIRQLALTQPTSSASSSKSTFLEQVLKCTYLAYAQRAKVGSGGGGSLVTLLPTLTFMGNGVVELYRLDPVSSYQHAFVYLRQLALHVRASVLKKTPESFRAVYNWQFVSCLKLWTAVLCSYGPVEEMAERKGKEAMTSLVYPLTEIIMGVARLVPTVRLLPLRFHCVRWLQQLAAFFGKFIPTSFLLLDVLDRKQVYEKRPAGNSSKRKNKKSGNNIRGVRLALLIKLPKDDGPLLGTTEQLDACMAETFALLNREVDLYRYSAGAPEYTYVLSQRLRKFSKQCKNAKYRAFARGTLDLCETVAKEAVRARSKLQVAPKDVKRLEILKPTSVPSMKERLETFIAKEQRWELTTPTKPQETNEKKPKRPREDNPPRAAAAAAANKKAKRTEKTNNDKAAEEEEKETNTQPLEEDDMLEEGIDWSDEDDEAEKNANDDDDEDEDDDDDENDEDDDDD